jgi:hypothetical protein
MKDLFKYSFLSWIAILAITACAPQEGSSPDIGMSAMSPDAVRVSVTPDANDPNLFHFKLESPTGCLAMFSCPEIGLSTQGVEFSLRIVWAGDYNLSVVVYNQSGMMEPVSVPFSVSETDPNICDNAMYALLTGGCDAANGKTWRIDNSLSGAIGCGEEGATSNNWWAPAPSELNPALVDDDMTFYLRAGQPFVLNNKGGSFMNESTASMFSDGDSSGSFVTTKYTPSDKATWAIITENGADWLVLTNGFPAYAVNAAAVTSGKYKILSLTETDMHIAFLPGGISWHYYLTSRPR